MDLLNDPGQARGADPDQLSLLLIDARNRTLRWMARFETAGSLFGGVGSTIKPWRWIGHAGWFQEHLIARHVQRGRGEQADPRSPRLPSVHPQADAWFAPTASSVFDDAAPPRADEIRAYLATTLDTTLDLLTAASTEDACLHPFRLALMSEDRLSERLAVGAQWLGVEPEGAGRPAGPPRGSRPRTPILWPASRALLGSPPGGLVPPNERWAHEVAVPAFEIDASPVSWARFAEFVQDGGYDDRRWWDDAGWRWLEQVGRRSPRAVAHWRGGVTVERHGQLRRCAVDEAAVHVTWHEAMAWCAWADRRLPTEAEWTLAATRGVGLGFAWGEVLEWMLGPARPYGAGPREVAGFADPVWEPGLAVLRGASSWAVPRAAHPQRRRFEAPERDDLFCGFRSCAL